MSRKAGWLVRLVPAQHPPTPHLCFPFLPFAQSLTRATGPLPHHVTLLPLRCVLLIRLRTTESLWRYYFPFEYNEKPITDWKIWVIERPRSPDELFMQVNWFLQQREIELNTRCLLFKEYNLSTFPIKWIQSISIGKWIFEVLVLI